MPKSYFSRRKIISAGGAAGLTALLADAAAGSASAQTPSGASPAGEVTVVIDLGSAIVEFSLMSAQLVGNTLFIGSRNVEPVQILALDGPGGQVVGRPPAGHGPHPPDLVIRRCRYHSVRRLAAEDRGPAVPSLPLGSQEPGLAVGCGLGTAPALGEYVPATGAVVSRGRGLRMSGTEIHAKEFQCNRIRPHANRAFPVCGTFCRTGSGSRQYFTAIGVACPTRSRSVYS